jgi:glucokinase
MKKIDTARWKKGEESISAKHVLLGDIGATNARFALLEHGTVSSLTSFNVARFARFADVVRAFLQGHCQHAEVAKAVFAVAGPVEGSRCVLTNSSWIVDVRELDEAFGLEALIVNDFEAVAYSLPSLASADVEGIGAGRAELAAPMAVLGPGSGLGVACLIPGHGKNLAITSEGGHATAASANEREDEIIKQLRFRFGHVSAERLISGQGLENIYQAIIEIDGLALGIRSAAEVTKCALESDCRVASEALRIFCGFLGSFAGNVALTFGARGGIYIAGGISPRIVGFYANRNSVIALRPKAGCDPILKQFRPT